MQDILKYTIVLTLSGFSVFLISAFWFKRAELSVENKRHFNLK